MATYKRIETPAQLRSEAQKIGAALIKLDHVQALLTRLACGVVNAGSDLVTEQGKREQEALEALRDSLASVVEAEQCLRRAERGLMIAGVL